MHRAADVFLERPFMYRLLHTATGLRKLHARLIEEVMRLFEDRSAVRVLDLGCGPGDTLPLLGQHGSYTGIDLNPLYVADAHRRNRTAASFVVGNATELDARQFERFDVILAFGLVHHLDDEHADRLLRTVSQLLTPAGRFVSLDGCRHTDSTPVQRWLLDHDRGRFVRNDDAYLALFSRHLDIDRTSTDASDMYIPYSVLSVTARPQDAAASRGGTIQSGR